MMCLDRCTAKMYFHIFVITYLIRSGGFLFFLLIFKQMNALICIYIISRQPRECSFHMLMELTAVISVEGQETLWSFTVSSGC